MIAPALLAAGGIVIAGLLASVLVRRLRGIRAQLTTLAITGVVLPLSAVVLTGTVMLKGHDALVIGIVAGASAIAASGVAIASAAPLISRLRGMREATLAYAGGDLDARIETGGPAELATLADAYNEMATKIGRLLESRRNLVAWATHDLRAPLASLQAMIEAVQDGVASREDYLPEMRRQVRTLARLVDDLFELSRIELNALTFEIMDVSLSRLADGCVRSMRPAAEERGVRLTLSGDDRAVARCAPDKVERVLMNLLTNALRHTPADGSVAIRVGAEDGAVVVAVEDTGEGLPDGEPERVFESFWRADPSRNAATGGAGLGLAIARGLVEAQGGRIWAEPRPEGGARFVFTLPAA